MLRIQYMRTLHLVFLTDEQRASLTTIIRSGSASARRQTRARILILTDQNNADRLTDANIMKVLGTGKSTIQRTRIRFLAEGIEGCLKDKPRSGRPPVITGDLEAKITVIACSEPPAGRCKWTMQLIADEMVVLGYMDSISKSTVHNHVKKTN